MTPKEISEELDDWMYISMFGSRPNIMINTRDRSVDVCLSEDYHDSTTVIKELRKLIKLIKAAEKLVNG